MWLYIRRHIKVNGLMFMLKVAMIAVVFYGTVKTANLAWAMGDVGVGLMAWLSNIVGILIIFFMAKPAPKALHDYEEQQKQGVTEYTFNPVKLGIKGAIIGKINNVVRQVRNLQQRSSLSQ